MSSRKVFFSKPAREAYVSRCRHNYIVASRGTTKSEMIDAQWLKDVSEMMPGCTILLVQPTYKKHLQNTLPAVAKGLERFGWYRDIHYVVGKKPPARMNFAKPLTEPFSYDYAVTLFNGTIWRLISFDVAMSANSMSGDAVAGFEAKYLDYDKLTQEVFPAVRGQREHFADCPMHGARYFSTDMPTMKSGNWILEKQKEMDVELVTMVKYYRLKIWEYETKTGILESTRSNTLRDLTKKLNQLVKAGTFFGMWNAIDNIEILGEQWIEEQRRNLPPLLFKTSILNLKPRGSVNGFYSSLNERVHTYTAENNTYLESVGYGTIKEGCISDGDIDKKQPLIISIDYNAAINSMVTCQVTGPFDKQTFNTLRSSYVKTPRKLVDLINDWCDYYSAHTNRDVVYYYDSTAIGDKADSSDSFATQVIKTLQHRGWNVEDIYMGQPPKHHVKHEWINNALRGIGDYSFPMFNKHNAEYLLIAMHDAGVKVGKNGFEKDKGMEVKPDSPDAPDEFKTHITDAWDMAFVGVNKYPYSGMSSLTFTGGTARG